jgi:hypothetical protein
MNKNLIVILLMTLYSCTDNSNSTTSNTNDKFKPLNRNYTKSDTVRFIHDSTRMAVVGLLNGILQADSSKKVPIDVLYYVNGNQISAYTDTFVALGEEELSHYFEATDTMGNSCEQFFTINYGFGACGYTQNKLTFSADTKNCYLIAHHESSADGAYGYGSEFYNMCKESSPKQVTSVIVSNAPVETDDNVILMEYSDSTVYTFDGNKWTSKLVTPKDTVFRTTKEKF